MSRQHKLTLLAVTIGTWSPLALGTRVRLCERVLGLAVTPLRPIVRRSVDLATIRVAAL